MKRFLPLGVIGIAAVLIARALFFGSTIPAQAVVSGGTGTIKLAPQSTSIPVGQEQSIDMTINTGGTAISGVAARLTIPVSGNDAQVTAVTGNTDLAGSGWSFPITTYATENGTTTIDIMAINSTVNGYSVTSDTKIATIKLKANSAFSGKALSFDTSMTKMLKKSDGSDMAAAPANGSYSTGAGGTTTTQAPTPTPTPTLAQGNAKPTCTGLTVTPSSGTGVPFAATVTCTGSDSNGTIAGAEFVFGDRTSQVVDKNVGNAGSIAVNHTYREVGSLRVTCRVRDNTNSYSDSSADCNKVITIRPGTAGGTTQPTATPTPDALATTTPDTTPVVDATPTAEPTYTEPITEEGSSFPWWLVGVVVGITVMIAGFILMRKQRGGPPPTSGQPYAPQPQPTYQPQTPPAAQSSAPPPYIPTPQAPPQVIPPAQTAAPTWPQNS